MNYAQKALISKVESVFTAYMTARITLLGFSAFLTLSACGFQPMYGSASPSAALSGSATEAGLEIVAIENIRDADGVHLRNALIDRFYRNGYPATPRYTLAVDKINEVRTKLDLTTEAEATRAQVVQSTRFVLTDLSTRTAVLTRKISSVSSYNILESEYATRASEQAARESSLNDLARQVELQVSLFLNRTEKAGSQ